MFSYQVGGQARPCGEVASVDSLCPGSKYWAERGTLQALYEVHLDAHFVCIENMRHERLREGRWRTEYIDKIDSIRMVADSNDFGFIIKILDPFLVKRYSKSMVTKFADGE